MANQNPHLAGRFSQAAEKPLARRVTGVRLPEDGDAFVQSLPDSERSDWLRQVIMEAVRRELKKSISKSD